MGSAHHLQVQDGSLTSLTGPSRGPLRPGLTAEGTDEQRTRDHSRAHGGCVRAGLQPSASLRPERSATVQLSSGSREGPLARMWRWNELTAEARLEIEGL